MDFSLRFVVSLLLGAMILLMIVMLLQQNTGGFEGFLSEFMTLE